jgi:uncharacterized protein
LNKEIAMASNPILNLKALEPPVASQPWWRFGIMWLTLGLPATVVVASLVTASIAWRNIDPVISETATSEHTASPLEPAQRARNHAATPAK